MDHDGRNAAALQADTALAATIVKSIDELERNHRLAEGPLSEKLMRGIEATMRAAAPEPWEVAPTEWSILLRSTPEWKPTRGLGNGDAWIQLNEVTADELERTWIGVATSAGGKVLGRPTVLSTDQQAHVRARRAEGASLGALATELGVSRSAIHRAEKKAN